MPVPRGIRVDRDGPGGRVSSPTNDRTHGTGACRENLAMLPRPPARFGRKGCCPLGWQRRIAALGLRSMPPS